MRYAQFLPNAKRFTSKLFSQNSDFYSKKFLNSKRFDIL